MVDKSVSYTERRKLASFPEFKLEREYIEKIDKYLLDHFPYRDSFRGIKANFNYKVLGYLDNNDIYLDGNYIFKSNYPTNYKSISNFVNKAIDIEKIFSDNNIYMMVIPDKNYYLESDDFLHIDYNYIYEKVSELGFKNIDIRDVIELSDYYETDTHLRQEKLDKVISRIGYVMGRNYYDIEYKENYYDNFYGVYYGEAAIDREPERLVYLTNEILDNVYVKYLENDKLNSLYNLEKLTSVDSYEVYLDGASAFIEISNDNSSSDRELIVFRDSFASSITPLLVPYYKKITLIDNRYISSSNYLKELDIRDQDVILMYSTLLINNSSSLKG